MSLSLSMNYMLFFEFCSCTLLFEMSLYCSSGLIHGISHLCCSHFMTRKPIFHLLSSCSAMYLSIKCCLKLETDNSYFYTMVEYLIIYISKWNHLYKSKGNFSVKYIIFKSVCIIIMIISPILQYLIIAYTVGILKYFILCLPPLFQGSLPAYLLLPENWAAFSWFISDLQVHPHLQPWHCEPHTVQFVLKIKLFSLMVFFLPRPHFK